MANQPWMQQEEAAFLADPAAVFNAALIVNPAFNIYRIFDTVSVLL